MSRMLRALVALFAVVGLVSPLLGACLCAPAAPAADPHACCPAPAGPRLSAAHDCCTEQSPDDLAATVAPAKALVEAAPAMIATVGDVPAAALPAPSHSVVHLQVRTPVLRI
jgi:hypothetical protein